ncbi:pilus assembly PilX family protein [Pseudomonas sp.]|uniref:pilus assembly PilX family protein n=1 Tax=Pseudomonas sp. TaxID=306 RepID=UPI003C75A92A
MKSMTYNKENGAVLIIALVMLLVITVLTVTNMRETTLEGRMTANRMENQQLINATESAIREAEKRYYGPGNIRDKVEANIENCRKENLYRKVGNKPCLIQIADLANPTNYNLSVNNFLLDPISYIKSSSAHNNWTGSLTDSAGNDSYIPWMPYRGTSPGDTTKLETNAYWNTALIDSVGINAEYGDAQEGKGTYYYLVTGQAKDQLAIQSTIANIYLGLNN